MERVARCRVPLTTRPVATSLICGCGTLAVATYVTLHISGVRCGYMDRAKVGALYSCWARTMQHHTPLRKRHHRCFTM